jgi:hypothetical protein
LSDDASVTWGLAAGAAAQLDAATTADFRRSNSRRGAGLTAPDSLLELSIRLNV